MSAPTLRRLPVPVSEPFPSTRLTRAPAASASAHQQHMLDLTFSASTQPDPAADAWAGPQPTSPDRLPDPREVAGAVVQAVVEVLAGTRPAGQLVRWLSADVYAALQRRAALAARLRRPPTSALARQEPAPVRRAVVRSVHTTEPVPGVVEASAVVVDRGRVRAVALRLEGLDGRWRATALEMG